jgi:putative acetyltransferase
MNISKQVISEVSVRVADPYCPETRALFQALWDELGQLYGDTGPCRFFPTDVAGAGTAFVIAWQSDQAVGCGAVRPLEPGIAEVKRMYVAPASRRLGIARRILAELETQARSLGYTRLHLETGTLQPEAIRLYEQAGYERIVCFGNYAQDPLSVCFGKSLSGSE